MDMLTCTRCQTEKPEDQFGISRSRGRGRQYYCIACNRAAAAEYSKTRRQKYRKVESTPDLRQSRRLAKRGLTVEEFETLTVRSGGLCEICREKPVAAIDHDKVTGKVRGMLCAGCNTGIGKLGDTPAGLQAAIDYLQRAAANPIGRGHNRRKRGRPRVYA